MTLRQALKEFLLMKRLHGLQKQTVASYDTNIRLYLAAVGPDTLITDLTWEMTADYILDLLDRDDLSRATVSSYVRDLKIFLRWISEEYTLPFDYAKIKVPKSPKKHVKIYSDQEIDQIFDLCKTSVPWITARNKVIVALCLDSGLRQCEIINLLRSDVYWDLSIAKVTGKGAKDRVIPIGSTVLDLLQEYLQICPYDSDHVFVNRWGGPVTKDAIKQFMSKLQRKLPFPLSSHKLRHNYATNFCVDHLRERGRTDVYDLSILMGHESIDTTKRYEHFAHEILAAENSISHLDKIRKNGVQDCVQQKSRKP